VVWARCVTIARSPTPVVTSIEDPVSVAAIASNQSVQFGVANLLSRRRLDQAKVRRHLAPYVVRYPSELIRVGRPPPFHIERVPLVVHDEEQLGRLLSTFTWESAQAKLSELRRIELEIKLPWIAKRVALLGGRKCILYTERTGAWRTSSSMRSRLSSPICAWHGSRAIPASSTGTSPSSLSASGTASSCWPVRARSGAP
jgi:hypothetical protein